MTYYELGSISRAVEHLGVENSGPQNGVHFLDKGRDSYVYRVGEYQVMKVYRPHLDLIMDMTVESRIAKHAMQLRTYRVITNRISDYLSHAPLVLDSWWAEGARLVVNPITHMVWSEDLGCMVGVSPYIDGETVLGRYKSQNSGLTDRDFRPSIEQLNLALNGLGRCRGIRVDQINMKFQNGDTELVVTDLCGNINHLSA